MSNAGDPLQHAHLAARLTELEMHFMHLQRTVQDLNDVVLRHGKQLDHLDRRLAALAAILPALDAASRASDLGEIPPSAKLPPLPFGTATSDDE